MNKELLESKIELVINRLMNLEVSTADTENVSADDLKIGLYPRDFGIDIWDWPQGVGLYGFHRYENFKTNPKYETFFEDWFNGRMEEGLPPKNVNTTAPMLTLLDYAEGNPKFEALCAEWAKFLVEELPKTKENGFQHVTSDVTGTGVILNESEMWIDTIFMTVLFLNKYAQKTNNEEYKNVAKYQVLQHIKYLYNPIDKLFYHGYSFNNNDNFGKVYWCRGNSWFTYGIIDFLEMCGDEEDRYLKDFTLQVYKNQVDKLLELQNENGMWHTVVDDETSYLESSGSAAIVAGILKGIRLGILDEATYMPACERCIETLLEYIDEDGTVTHVSGGTGIGMDVDHYKNIIVTPIAYGQSLAIIALNEYYLHLKSKEN